MRRLDLDLGRVPRLWLGVVVLGLAAPFLYYGLYRGITNPTGDFVNYYTASHLALSHQFTDIRLYDFYWFNQFASRYFSNPLSGFIPHPPAAVLPLMPLAWLPPQTARIALLTLNLALLGLCILGLSQVTRLPKLWVAFLLLLNGVSLWNNFREGQLYVVLLTLAVAGLWLYVRGWPIAAGVAFGLFIPIKYFLVLYVLYFLVRREWRVVFGAACSALGVALLGLYWTNWSLNVFFVTQILPYHLAGQIQNYFSVHFQSYSSLFNRLFVYEVSLNPTPVANLPLLRDFLKSLVSGLGLALTVLGLYHFEARINRDQANFAIALLTLFGLVTAPASATYHLVLLILPATLLAGLALERTGRMPVVLVIVYGLINLWPFDRLYGLDGQGGWTIIAYSKLFLLSLYFLMSLPRNIFALRSFRWSLVGSLAFSLALLVVRPQPVTDDAQWLGYDGLIIRNLSEQNGEVFYVRDVANGYARFANGVETATLPPPARAVTQDGLYQLYAAPVRSSLSVHSQIFVRDTRTGTETQLTFAPAINTEPVWSSDDQRVYFLSDRGRGVDCTTIYYIDFKPGP
jgi:hypothetical protein